MRKLILAASAAMLSVCAMADDTTKVITCPDGTTREVVPVATMKVTVDGETVRSFSFGSYKASDYYAVDFGDGNLVVTEEIGATTSTATKTAVSGVAQGEGNITVYANDSVWYFNTSAGMSTTSPVTAIDLKGLKNVQQLSVSGVACETLDLSGCDSLRVFTSAKGALTSMDFSANAKVTNINLSENRLTSVNVSGNPLLENLTVFSNALTSLDLSANTALTNLYAQDNQLASIRFAQGEGLAKISYLNLDNNQLVELDVPMDLGNFQAKNNKISRVTLKDCTKSCNIENNRLTIATLPKKPAGLNTASKIKKFTYAPQEPLSVDGSIFSVLDLSSQLKSVGELEEEAVTNYLFINENGDTLTVGEDYTATDGLVRFAKAFTGIHGVMTTDAFPKATGDLAFTTTVFSTSPSELAKEITCPDGTVREVVPVATMKVTVDGETARTFSFGSYKESDYYAVDFGDGNLVVTEEIGATTSTATKTAVSGAALGEGNITVYANDSVWYFNTSAGMSTTSPVTAIDLKGLKNVQQLSVSGVACETLDLSGCDSLRVFTSAKGALTSMDFSANAKVTNINLSENRLTSVNVSGNPLLENLTVFSNALTSLDLSANTALTNLYAQDNQLASIRFAQGEGLAKISYLNLDNNQLAELDVPMDLGNFQAKNNKISRVTLKDCTKSCNIENNRLTIATLPKKPAGLNTASKIKKFTYAPQEPLSVDENIGGTLDLSAQLKSVGELEEEATTVFAFADAEGNMLVEGEDFTMEGGVASFLKPFTNIHGVMTTEAFPKAVDALAFTTTVFSTTAVPTCINAMGTDSKEGVYYNLQGVKVATPAKGVNITNGHKVYIK